MAKPKKKKKKAGFRWKMECIAHVAVVYEWVQRCRITKDPLFVAFMDLRSAYDMVPHAVLFHKLRAMGLEGRWLRLIENLYGTTFLRVLTQSGLTDRLPQRRGVRQGCTASPLLFNVMINDLLATLWVRANEGGCLPTGKEEGVRLNGLMFADDTVLFASKREDLTVTLRCAEEWAMRNGMEFNAGKCGVLGINVSRSASSGFRIHGQDIPHVESYRYLGVELDGSGTLDREVQRRVHSTRRILGSLFPVFRNRSLPVCVRLEIFRSKVLPVALWGSELWGCNQRHAQRIQTVLLEGLRGILGVAPSTSVYGILYETNIPPVYAMASARRVRLYRKLQQEAKPYWAGFLAQERNRLLCRSYYWSKMTRIWITKLEKSCQVRLPSEPRKASRMVRSLLWQRFLERTRRRRHHVVEWHEQVLLPPAVKCMQGMWGEARVLLRLRLHAYFTLPRLARIGLVPARWGRRCVFCEGTCAETPFHMVMECPAWHMQRTLFFAQLPVEIQDLCVEGQYAWITGAVIRPVACEATARSLWSLWRERSTYVARYLQRVHAARAALLRRLLRALEPMVQRPDQGDPVSMRDAGEPWRPGDVT
eukprot:TRINITY_DN3388_c0_g1_i2.p2 TRINITY_DN3388_c0_g1~~TRINITY_DN3388_c0_g1_i2.p2  ORF type:complete len:592 (-),score=58.16 TRINITY_DN3388_c0_g1_i2:132-1907(-)